MTGDTFAFKTTKSTVKGRIDAFIAWASPGGTGGFNRAHSDRYVAAAPWFEYSAALMPHSHETQRSWFIKQEHLNRSRLFTKARSHELPEVTVPDAMIKDGRFLRFAKAYVNIYCAIRGLRSAPKSAVRALIYLEKALRDLNDGDNDPSAICHQAVHRAALTAQRCIKSASKRFDIGKALEHISLLVQTGGRFKGDKKHGAFPGFCLLETNFSFRSPIKSPPRFGKKRSPSGDGSRRDADPANLTSEEVAAVGMAYRRARDHFGSESSAAFFAALVGLTLTTASMRASELQSLRVDALYQDKDASKRWRLRIPRPKIGIEQDLPIPRRLSEIARELFELVKQQTAEARAAFAFYIAQSPDTPADIRTLFIPDRLKPLFASHYFTSEQVTNKDRSTPTGSEDASLAALEKLQGEYQELQTKYDRLALRHRQLAYNASMLPGGTRLLIDPLPDNTPDQTIYRSSKRGH